MPRGGSPQAWTPSLSVGGEALSGTDEEDFEFDKSRKKPAERSIPSAVVDSDEDDLPARKKPMEERKPSSKKREKCAFIDDEASGDDDEESDEESDEEGAEELKSKSGKRFIVPDDADESESDGGAESDGAESGGAESGGAESDGSEEKKRKGERSDEDSMSDGSDSGSDSDSEDDDDDEDVDSEDESEEEEEEEEEEPAPRTRKRRNVVEDEEEASDETTESPAEPPQKRARSEEWDSIANDVAPEDPLSRIFPHELKVELAHCDKALKAARESPDEVHSCLARLVATQFKLIKDLSDRAPVNDDTAPRRQINDRMLGVFVKATQQVSKFMQAAQMAAAAAEDLDRELAREGEALSTAIATAVGQ